MSKKKESEIARVFRALAVEKRVEIVRLLTGGKLCVGALSNLTGISPGAVSQHLRILKDAGLVEPDRRGFFIHYGLEPGAGDRCRAVLDLLFQTKPEARKGGARCAMEKQNAEDRMNIKGKPRNARRSKLKTVTAT